MRKGLPQPPRGQDVENRASGPSHLPHECAESFICPGFLDLLQCGELFCNYHSDRPIIWKFSTGALRTGAPGMRKGQQGHEQGQSEFPIKAATRHHAFNYGKVAEYYADATPGMQGPMEDSAPVIIDVDDAIAKGYAKPAGDIGFVGGDDDA